MKTPTCALCEFLHTNNSWERKACHHFNKETGERIDKIIPSEVPVHRPSPRWCPQRTKEASR